MERVEWLASDDRVLAVSDYEKKQDYLSYVGSARASALRVALAIPAAPLVLDHSEEKGAIRYRQVEYSRMPLLAYLAMEDARQLTRADFIASVSSARRAFGRDALSQRHVWDFEKLHCFDQFWNEERTRPPRHSLHVVRTRVRDDRRCARALLRRRDGGLLGQFRHQYFLLFLIPHFHKAALLMLSDRVAHALDRLQISDADSIKRVQAQDPAAARDLPALHAPLLVPRGLGPAGREGALPDDVHVSRRDRLYDEVRDEIEDMSDYLEADTLRRQANTVVRLTVVTTFGLIGTVVTGFLGMNLFALSEQSTPERILYFVLT
jgi:hypothetical protein